MLTDNDVTSYLEFEYTTLCNHVLWCEIELISIDASFDHEYGYETQCWSEINWKQSKLYLKRNQKQRKISPQLLSPFELNRLEEICCYSDY